MKRIFWIVLDSAGIGEAPDADKFGDVGSNTWKSCYDSGKLHIPNMEKIGIYQIDGMEYAKSTENPTGSFAKMQELSCGKDTTTGHWEMAGIVTPDPLPKFPDGFPKVFIEEFSKRTGRKILCNLPYSGTQVIHDYGREQEETGALIEILLLKRRENDIWECLVKPGKKARPGAKITFGNGILKGEIIDVVDEGNRLIQFHYEGIFEESLDQLGEMPLPPYITHKLKDKNRYQTVYAKNEGSAAAPTAGLHFTKELLEKVKEKGVNIAHVTLHVGLGTFRPVKVDDVESHHMHSEFYIVEEDQAKLINDTKKAGKRVIAVGTTSCRTLESATGEDGILKSGSGWTEIFIYPGYHFKMIDALITNFHLPESTLVMLVSALAGKENIMHAYETAVQEKYRFFSFGDAMIII